jgi:hypothetical protein
MSYSVFQGEFACYNQWRHASATYSELVSLKSYGKRTKT